MSIDQANIRMLRALGKSATDQATKANDAAESMLMRKNRDGVTIELIAATLLARISMACEHAANILDQNPIRAVGEVERLDNPET